ncbi:MAG: hypothetical protein R3E83_16970 [Burkholderiaceae bacterium]
MPLNLVTWGMYFAFVAVALIFSWHDSMLSFGGGLGVVKMAAWAVFVLFTRYSIYCSAKENLFKTVRQMSRLHWGRQIGIDLYLGLLLFLLVVYLHGGPIVLVLWLLPTLLFANLATFLYVAIHADSLIARLPL